MFSSRFDSEEKLLASMKGTTKQPVDTKLHALSQRLESLRQLSDRLKTMDTETSDLSKKGIFVDEEKESKNLSSLLQGVIPKQKPRKSLKERAMESKEKMKEVTRIKTGRSDED